MSDFYQHHHFTTLHRLERLPMEEFEAGLERAAARRRMALILPSLASEMDGPALPHIVSELKHVHYIHRIVVALDQADEIDYRRALERMHLREDSATETVSATEEVYPG